MYTHILVCYDESANGERAIKEAVKIARDTTRITLLHVIPTKSVGIEIGAEKVSATEYYLNKLKAFTTYHENIEPLILAGNVSKVILNHLVSNQYDLVVIGARGLGGLSKRLFGSVSSQILSESNLPVLLVK